MKQATEKENQIVNYVIKTCTTIQKHNNIAKQQNNYTKN